MLAALVLYAQIFPSLAADWIEFRFLSHGFLIPFIAGYLIWTRRRTLRGVAPTPSWWGAPMLAAGLVGFVVGMVGQESFVARVSFPLTLLGLTWFLAGSHVLRETWVGIAYLFLMVPPPWTTITILTYRSRLFDAWASGHALNALGIPVLRDGFMLHLPNISLEVADACSSIPALTALLCLG